MNHLVCRLFDIKFTGPVPLEINGIDQDKSGQGVEHVRLDQILDLGLGDLLNPVVDQTSRGFSVAVVRLLKNICCSVLNSSLQLLKSEFET